MGINGINYSRSYLDSVGIQNIDNKRLNDFPKFDENGKLRFEKDEFVSSTKTQKQKLDQATPYIAIGSFITGLTLLIATKGKIKLKPFNFLGNLGKGIGKTLKNMNPITGIKEMFKVFGRLGKKIAKPFKALDKQLENFFGFFNDCVSNTCKGIGKLFKKLSPFKKKVLQQSSNPFTS